VNLFSGMNLNLRENSNDEYFDTKGYICNVNSTRVDVIAIFTAQMHFGVWARLVGIQTFQIKIWANQNLGLPYQNVEQKI
jgi:hypothetical protein